MDKQRTIGSKISFEGIGLHTGTNTRIEILPALANTGIVFLRQDVESATLIKADVYSILDPNKFPRRTCIGTGEVNIHTVEHLMAAFHLLGVDNAQVNIWGEEVPGLDGSAKGFIESMRVVGIKDLDAPKDYLTVREPLWVDEGDCNIVILPSPQLRISYALSYDNALVGSSYIDLIIDGDIKDNFYEARTFCLKDEVQALLDMGLGKGANYKNTLVVSDTQVLDNELRFPDEFAKHKILDLIGDLYLAGPLKGHVIAIKSGHSLNIKLLGKLKRYRDKARNAAVVSTERFVPTTTELNVTEIMKILPHRYPFLLVDRITELDKGKRAVGLKSVTMNEQFFQGHFPGRPVMPGVLIVEAMAQVGGVLMLSCEEHSGKLAFFMAVNNIKFRKTVEPGDQLVFEVVAGKVRSKTGTVHGKAYVDGKVVAQGDLMFALVEA